MPSATATGGAEEALWQLLSSAAAKCVRWQVIFLEDGPFANRVSELVADTQIVTCGRTREFWKWWRAAGEIAQHAKNFGSSLILGWMTKGHVYGGLAGVRAGISSAWFQMGLPEDGLLDYVSRLLPARTIFACSEFAASEQRKKQPHANIVAIPLGVDLSRFDVANLPTPAEARAQLGLPADKRIVGMVGRLQRWKGMHVFIESIPQVLRQEPNTHFVIVGGPFAAEPDYERQLHHLAKGSGVADSITFAGPQQNVELWMQAMDVFVHASDSEPFGLVVIEALALGKPVLACAPGGPEEILARGAKGALLPYGDSMRLGASICSTLATLPFDSSLQRQVGLSFSSKEYSENVVSQLATLISI